MLLPGISVLTRLVLAVREAAEVRTHSTLADAVVATDPLLPGRLRESLMVPPGARVTPVELWRRSPTRVSGPGMVRAWDRAAELAGAVAAVDEDCGRERAVLLAITSLFAVLHVPMFRYERITRSACGRGIVALEVAGSPSSADALLDAWGQPGQQAARR
ncbi:hypothetical protein ND748_16625 [Frankia sp. AiPs1]|uniref:hypothetical protein n=1 Tax=Frankia sp. AiPs1 TaxID=573493 RepID=UPI0020431839|nr:hypothetical protein [Frankia sp. AiPs1]MCM3923279.1 hypothetical protein [Frankia sp. AiPs1]